MKLGSCKEHECLSPSAVMEVVRLSVEAEDIPFYHRAKLIKLAAQSGLARNYMQAMAEETLKNTQVDSRIQSRRLTMISRGLRSSDEPYYKGLADFYSAKSCELIGKNSWAGNFLNKVIDNEELSDMRGATLVRRAYEARANLQSPSELVLA